ncbi:hypothetical protein [Ekhidna sp.]
MKLATPTPKVYIGSHEESMAKALNLGFLILFITLPIILLQQVLKNEYVSASLVAFGCLSAIIVRFIFVRGFLRSSIYLFVLSFTLIVTGICTFGNGINDISIISYPILIGFSSVILHRKELYVTTALSLIGVVWLVFGDLWNLYDPIAVTNSLLSDFIVTSTIVVLGGYVASTLTFNMKTSLEKAQEQTQKSRKDSEILGSEVESKEQIIYEINRKVIDSLRFIRGFIGLQENSTKNILAYQSLKIKILAVETIHEQLIETTNYNVIEVKRLTQQLIKKYTHVKKLNIDSIGLSFTRRFSATMDIDGAIALAICVITMIDSIKSEKLRFQKDLDQLTIHFYTDKNDDSHVKDQVLLLMIQQLKGQIQWSVENHAFELLVPLKRIES